MATSNEISPGLIQSKENTSNEKKLFFKQLLIASGVWTSYYLMGVMFGSPTVLIPQMRRDANSTKVINESMVSWLTAVFGYAALPWVVVIPYLALKFGRKKVQILISFNTLIGCIVFYTSKSALQVLISEIIHGMGSVSHITLSIMILTEYTAPKYRGIFLVIKSGSSLWGVWTANAIGTYFHWRNIALFSIICSTYTILTSFFWPESPYWLASKGRYEECVESHCWLKGVNESSQKELNSIILRYKEQNDKNTSKKISLKYIVETVSLKAIFKPILLTVLAVSSYFVSGKVVCEVYAVQIIEKITGNNSTAYTGMLILDGITILSMYVGCALSRIVNRRTLLLTNSTLATIFLTLLVLYLYMVRLSVIREINIVSIPLLIMFSMSVCSGSMIMASTIAGELLPLNFRSTCCCMSALAAKLLLGVILQISPYLFTHLGADGAFLCFVVASIISTIMLYIFLPETKDKTLQEIAEAVVGRVETVSEEAKQCISYTKITQINEP